MVVKCSDCKTLLRLDAKKITEGSNSSVRCPKCGAEGLLEMSTIEYDGSAGMTSVHQQVLPTSADHGVTNIKHAGPSAVNLLSGNPHEMTMPEDAFREFRFPVEGDSPSDRRPTWSFRPRMIVLGAVSILVIAVFATLVNIILPGPPPASVEHISDLTGQKHN